jgi:hypothetical protein
MQAYASAELNPLTSRLRLAPVQSVEQAVDPGVNTPTRRFDSAASASSILTSLILNGLDDHDLAALARRLLPHLRQAGDREAAQPHTRLHRGVARRGARCFSEGDSLCNRTARVGGGQARGALDHLGRGRPDLGDSPGGSGQDRPSAHCGRSKGGGAVA